ncbi:glycosyltransferase [Mediterraneibacter butyricigenes]|nr:glycosyltransferase [Mediterraneibacter butyricigenes]
MSVKKENKTTAGAKAPEDVTTICRKIGAQEIVFSPVHSFKNLNITRFFALFIGIKNWINLLFVVKKNSYVIIQHPNENILVANKFINVCKQIKKCKFITLIHDLESLRRFVFKNNSTILNNRSRIADETLLKKSDYIISHNENMTKYLVERGFDSSKIVNLKIFDYLHECDLPDFNKDDYKTVVIAGNLDPQKATYIYQLDKLGKLDYKINLFGPNYDARNDGKNIQYYGQCSPEELPEKLIGGFGLVWDGTELDGCHGNAGEYIKYNNPHKCSLFLASGLPVIIWEEAALAPFVLENHVGFTVRSLKEINDILKNMDIEEYSVMKHNVVKISEKLRQGHYLKNAIKEIMEKENIY